MWRGRSSADSGRVLVVGSLVANRRWRLLVPLGLTFGIGFWLRIRLALADWRLGCSYFLRVAFVALVCTCLGVRVRSNLFGGLFLVGLIRGVPGAGNVVGYYPAPLSSA